MKTGNKKHYFIVECVVPKGATITETANFIASSTSMCGSFHPEDPLFYFDRDQIRVVHLTPKRLAKLTQKETLS